MTTLRGTAVVAHGGGPTAVLNSSLAGVIHAALQHPAITALYGARNGADGLIGDDFLDLGQSTLSPEAISRAPGSAIGSSRRKILPADYEAILSVLRRRDVRYLFYTGGNGSMETALSLDRGARDAGWELRVVGIPKTIDNDLAGTDHTPGYPSCARFFVHAVRDVGEDNRALPPPIEIIEVLGRNTGWVVAATALARHYENDPPHLVYFPECGVSLDRIAADVERVYRRLGRCLVAVCEGQTDEHGNWFDADVSVRPGARDPLPSNMGHTLARLLMSRIGLRCRAEKAGLIGRSSSALASPIDRLESWQCGEAAVRAAVEGRSGVMISLERTSEAPYRCRTSTIPLSEVANRVRPFPAGWIGPEKNDVSPDFLEWLRPLVGPLEPHARL